MTKNQHFWNKAGNTGKVAFTLKKAFENKGCKGDAFKVDTSTDNTKLPFAPIF